MEIEATDAPASETGLSVDLGTEGAPAEEVGAPEAPEQVEDTSPLDFSQIVTVKVNGSEEQVSLQEAINGYQRNAAFTQGMQQLAADREQLSNADRLWQAIESNPQTTIAAIAEAYGYKLTPAQEQALEAQRGDDPFAVDDEDVDPIEQRLRQVEQLTQQAQNDRLQAQIDRELAVVHQRYNVQFNDDDLLQYALDNRVGDLDTAFRAFAFEQMTKVAQDKRVQQKKAALPPVASGHGTAAGVVAPGPGVGQRMSLEDAYAAAQAQTQA